MAKDESRVQSLLSAFTRKRSAPPKERAEVKDAETTKPAYTPAMRTAVAGITGVAFDLARTSLSNRDERFRKLTPSEQVFSALETGARAAGAVGAFTHTEGKPMAARLALSGAAFFAAGAPLMAVRVAGKDLAAAGKQTDNGKTAMAAVAGPQVFGRVVRRPFL